MPESHTPQLTDWKSRVGSAALPPVAAEAAERLYGALADKADSGATESEAANSTADRATTDSARSALAGAYRHIAVGIADPARRPYEVLLLALAAGTLAEAHGLERKPGNEPCTAALDLVAWILREWRPYLRTAPRQLLENVVDAVALESGRAGFLREVRRLLMRSERRKPTVLNVDAATTIMFGGVRASYRCTKVSPDGERGLGRALLSASNAAGRLVLLVADGRPPTAADASVVSRAASAVRFASRGAVELSKSPAGPLRFYPPVELSARATRVAQSVRSLHVRPRLRKLEVPGRGSRKTGPQRPGIGARPERKQA